jgi:ribosomal protein L7/L12
MNEKILEIFKSILQVNTAIAENETVLDNTTGATVIDTILKQNKEIFDYIKNDDISREYSIYATALSAFPKKIHAIKLIRQITEWGLKDAKDFIEQFENNVAMIPQLIIANKSKSEVDTIQSLFNDVGLTTIIKHSSNV